MRDPNRIPQILHLLGLYWDKYPDLRLGQIICNLTPENYRKTVVVQEASGCFPQQTVDLPDPYHVEDDDWQNIFFREIFNLP